MKISVIACGVFRTDLETLLPDFPYLKVTYLEGGLHSEPNLLRGTLQEAINAETEADRIILLYGLCGSGTAGLKAGKASLVIPRVHDCISLFLGSDGAYAREFRKTPGTYYISAGWYEEQVQPRGTKADKADKAKKGERAENGKNRESGENRNETHSTIRLDISDTPREELVKRYGEENTEAILQVTHSWKKNYQRAVFIDTGSGDRNKYSSHVDAIGQEFGWRTETIKGSNRLLEKALTAGESDDEILIIPPGQISYYDPAARKMKAAPPESSSRAYSEIPREYAVPGKGGKPHAKRRYGLGIDAGGTYTDAVLFDFQENRVQYKAKALTTPWNYTEGIRAALEQIPPENIAKTEIVSVSTTLATNAIVENNRQEVGLLLMPLAGSTPREINHSPRKIIRGRINISGEVIEEPDTEEILAAAAEMIRTHGVQAFAVSGYGGSVNPVHEKQIAALLRRETGLMVCAGHELSGQLDFTIRAATAVLNAGIIPHLETFFHAAEACLKELGINAPVLFVRGDGFLMNSSFAMEHPIETALSGPAASVAGAGYLTGLPEATIIDVGGTTSDIGCIHNGRVEPDPNGAVIGSHRTHVQAVDMVTLGIGGDSIIRYRAGVLSVGPERITPLCRLSEEESYVLKTVSNRIDDLSGDTDAGLILRSTGKKLPFAPDRVEQKVLDSLAAGPMTMLDVAEAAGLGHWRFLKLNRLFSVRCLERIGLTPTDLLHTEKRLKLGNPETAALGLNIHASAAGMPESEYSKGVWQKAEELISSGVVSKLMDIPLDDPATALLVGGGTAKAAVQVSPAAPIVGLGAAAPYLLGGIKPCFGMEALIPENADVANAIGAITSSVHAAVSGSIIPVENGFRINGETETIFPDLTAAELTLEQELIAKVRDQAARAGTSEDSVDVMVVDRTARSALGDTILLERRMAAEIRGLPDLF